MSPRPFLRNLQPAVHGGFGDEERAALGLPDREVLDFSVNTNPFGPAPAVLEAIRAADVTRYPDPTAAAFRRAVAARHGVTPEQVVAGNGSVDLIWTAARAYLGPGDVALVLGPTFGEYEAATIAAGARPVELRAGANGAFRPDVAAVEAKLAELRPPVMFLCNPNNPTGTLLPNDRLQNLARAFPDTLLVVDEAYLPFAEGGASCIGPGQPENMLVLRSMTKDCAIPGLRLGYGIATAAVAAALRALQPPWSINAVALAAGVAALVDGGYSEKCLAAIPPAREYLRTELLRHGLGVLPSAANFLLVRTGDGAGFRRRLLEHGCCVRDGASFGLPEYIRIGVRTQPECERLIEAVARVIGADDPSRDREGRTRQRRSGSEAPSGETPALPEQPRTSRKSSPSAGKTPAFPEE